MNNFIEKIKQWDNLLAKVGNPIWEKHYKVCSIPQTVENQLKELLEQYENTSLIINKGLAFEEYQALHSLLENRRISDTSRARVALLYMKGAKKYFAGQLEVLEYLQLEKQQEVAYIVLLQHLKKLIKVSHH